MLLVWMRISGAGGFDGLPAQQRAGCVPGAVIRVEPMPARV